MDAREELERQGFSISNSGGDCLWYTKKIKYKGQDAFVAITDEGGCGLPKSLKQSVWVALYNMDGEELEEARKYSSLSTFLAGQAYPK